MNSGGDRQRAQVVRGRGEQLIAIDCEEHDRGVDDILHARASEQLPRPAAELEVERADLRGLKQPRDLRLARTASPDLADDPTMRAGSPPGQTLSLQQRHHATVTSLDGQKGTRIQDQSQALLLGLRPAGERSGEPRTTTARARAQRLAAAISSSAITPCFDS